MSQELAEKTLKEQYPVLVERARKMEELDRWYTGDHPLPFLTSAHADKMRWMFRRMLEESRTNFMRLVVDVVDERLEIDGLRLSAESDMQADKDTWKIWQANQMDSLSRNAIQDALIKGVSYLSVWPDADQDGYADIAVEDACETLVVYTPGSNFRRRDAALKVWKDGKRQRANIWLPDALYKFERTAESGSGLKLPESATKWGLITDGTAIVPHDFGVVPVIPVRNRGRTLIEGESEISDVTSVQSQINGFLFLLALAGYFGAHKQRWATGLTLVDDEETGKIKEPFDVAIDRILVAEEDTARFGEFQATDLTQYLKSIDQKASHIAIVTRTPKHYFMPEGQEPSGDSINSAESGLNGKLGRKKSAFGEAFEETMRLARKAQGDGETPVDSEVVWADTRTTSEAEKTDAAIKKYQGGLIPKEQALEDLGYTQTQINRIMASHTADALIAALAPGDGTAAVPRVPAPTGPGVKTTARPTP